MKDELTPTPAMDPSASLLDLDDDTPLGDGPVCTEEVCESCQ